MRSFAVRGVVEGFYGAPWSHDDRLDVISFLAERGMNAYVYAPKDDAKHRAKWRVPYKRKKQGRFADLARHSSAHGVRFGFAISPGLDIDYDAAAANCFGDHSPLRLLAGIREVDVIGGGAMVRPPVTFEYGDAVPDLGATLAAAGQTDEAVRAYSEAIRIQPDSLEARQKRADLMSSGGR